MLVPPPPPDKRALHAPGPPGALVFYCDDKRHLICVPYTRANLHRMAAELGIKPCWFHNGGGGRFPHYDIPKRRIAEVTARCQLTTSRILLALMKGEVPL